MTTLHLIIHGRVQGVFFRDSMRQEALKLEIAGWVRNRSDGTVEAVVHGESENVATIVRWAQHGPRHANVVKVDLESADGAYAGFEILYD